MSLTTADLDGSSASGGKPTVLITGASGFIGYHCVQPLLNLGYRVVGLYATRQPEPMLGVEWVQHDLFDRAATAKLLQGLRPRSLLHCAWYVEPGKMIESIVNLDWVQASIDLVRQFRESGGERCVITGSCYEYDWRYGYCNEELTPATANTFYGRAKNSLREAFTGYCAASGLSGAWGRLFFLYGPRENPRRLVSSLALSLLKGIEAPSSHGRQIRDYVHVQDAGDGLAALLHSTATGDYNIASGRAETLRTIIETLGQIAGRSDLLRIGAMPARANDSPLVVADTTRMTAVTGWSARLELADGLQHTLDWWRQQGQA